MKSFCQYAKKGNKVLLDWRIKNIIEIDFYFTINRPRQYGKIITLNEISNMLNEKYLVINISFEGIGDSVFEKEKDFCIYSGDFCI